MNAKNQNPKTNQPNEKRDLPPSCVPGAANHKGPSFLCISQGPFPSFLLTPIRHTDNFLVYLLLQNPGPCRFFEMFLINKCSPYCNSLNKIISLIIWYILSFILFFPLISMVEFSQFLHLSEPRFPHP